MNDASKWSVDNNGYYLTDWTYSPARTTPVSMPETLRSNNDPVYKKITFTEPTNVRINYSIGRMYAGSSGSSPNDNTIGYITNNTAYTVLATDSLGNASDIESITSNPIELTERTVELNNISELTIQTSGRPVLWVNYITIKDLNW